VPAKADTSPRPAIPPSEPSTTPVTKTRILVAEDDPTTAAHIQKSLERAGYSVTSVRNGQEALEWLAREPFDALITDWMMPGTDGIQLIRAVRSRISQPPLIVMITALASADSRAYALESGADEFLAKPFAPEEAIVRLATGLARMRQDAPKTTPYATIGRATPSRLNKLGAKHPPYVAVLLAASTGGPEALKTVVASLDPTLNVAYFLVQHGPSWAIDVLARDLKSQTRLKVQVAKHGEKVRPGTFNIAPAGKNLKLKERTFELEVVAEPPENHTCPAADPLFRSAAQAFGQYAIGVILTGLGRDGTRGAGDIRNAGGVVLVQDPLTATVETMPQTAIAAGVADEVVPLQNLATSIQREIARLAAQLPSREDDRPGRSLPPAQV
jgi:two-component system chemotaxis response regulator CheB